eukprot:g6.t1
MKSLFSSRIIRELHFSISKQSNLIGPFSRKTRINFTPVPHTKILSRPVSSTSAPVENMDLSEEVDGTEKNTKRTLDATEESTSEVLIKKSKKGRKNKDPVLIEAILKINDAAKHNERDKAMECFREGRDKGLRFNQGVMNSVLYLLVGGERWYENAKKAFSVKNKIQDDGDEADNVDNLTKWRDEVLDYMQKEQLMTDEMVYTAQARLSACLGDSDQAFLFVKEMLDSNIPARLRSFTPALLGFSENGQKNKALEVQNTIDGCNIDLTELEFQLILKACTTSVEYQRDYEDVESTLRRIGNELTYLQPETIQIAREYFNSEKSNSALTSDARLFGKKTWLVNDVEVDFDGYSTFAGDSLSATDLSEEDWNVFLEAFRKLATANEHKNKLFESFMDWHERHGPFNIIIDGANVAFHKQNYHAGHFSFSQIESIINNIEQRYPDEKPLVILHENRTKGKYAQTSLGKNLLTRLTQNKQLFKTPIGSNDDWYWLYAALKAKDKGLLISNDECRDHIFQLLTPKYFLKWKERHLVRYEFYYGDPSIKMPSNYTPCAQQLNNGTWMLPYQDNEKEYWFCAKPV